MTTRVLVIEDNTQNRYLFEILLKTHGYEVFQAVDGQSGIDLALKEMPDFIIVDIQLPDIDGYTLVSTLRKHAMFAKKPIIAVTSFAMSGDREKAIASGCTGYIEKPINPETFIQQLEEIIHV